MTRTLTVVALALFVVGLTAPNVFVSAKLANYPPMSIDESYHIVSVAPGSDPQKAGLRVGDRLDPQALTIFERLCLYTGVWAIGKPGDALPLVIERDGTRFSYILRLSAQRTGNELTAIVKRTSATLFIVVAAVLVMLRPSKMSWGFFFYALGSAQGAPLIMTFVGPSAAALTGTLLVTVFYTFLGPVGLLMFATAFPAPSSGGPRRTIERSIPYVAVPLALTSIALLLYILGVPLPQGTDAAGGAIIGGAEILAFIALVAGFRDLDPAQRQRLRWVVAAFVVYICAYLYQSLSPYLPGQSWPDAWYQAGVTSDILNGFVILIPISVSYAVLKHHVLDVNFVIGRGLVYGIMTSIAVAVFAVVEWFLSRILAQTSLATAGEIVAAIAIGFWMQNLHSAVDRFVDAFIFRRRHLAEQRLARVASGLPHADTLETVSAMVVSEPFEAFGLSSAALFVRQEDGEFRREARVGFLDGWQESIPAGDRLIIHLQGAREPLFLHDVGWKMDVEATAAAQLACPMFVRHELRGVVLYGGHVTGEAIDPDEVRSLNALCIGAAAAIDHIEAAELASQLRASREALRSAREDLERLRAAGATAMG